MVKEKETDSATGKTRSKSLKRSGNKSSEDATDADTSVVHSPTKTSKQGDKQSEKGVQSTLDKHFKSGTDPLDLSELLKNVQENMKTMQNKLDQLASRDYIEQRFKAMVTETVLTEKLNELKSDIRSEMEKDLGKVKEDMNTVLDRVSSMESTISTLRNKTSDLELKNEALEAQCAKIEGENRKLAEKVEDQAFRIKVCDTRNNNLEQYTRRNSLRIYGIPDSITETATDTCSKIVKFLNEKLKIKVATEDIDVAHRMGRYQNDGYRVVVVKLVQRMVKMEILRARRALKGSSYVVREDLTNMNAKLLEAVSDHPKVKSAWSDEGRIVVQLRNNRKLAIKELIELDKISIGTITDSRPAPGLIGNQTHS